MPFHLPPISRREFVARTLAAGAGILTAARLGAEETEIDPDRWALFSDTHLSEDTATIWRGEPMFANARRVNREVLGLSKRPHAVINFGDCAFKQGLPGDYNTLRSTIAPLADSGLAVHLMVGNHDARVTFWKSLSERIRGPSALQNKHAAVVEHARANWFLLDSLDETDASPGTLGAEQCAWLARELDARAAKPALVCVHHNPLIEAKPAKTSGLTDTAALLTVVMPRKQVKALIFGHTHAWEIRKHRDLHLINLPAVGYPSKSGGAPTGWVECALREAEMQLVLHSRDTAHKDHRRPINFVWRPA